MSKIMTNRVDELYDMLVAVNGDVKKIADPFLEDLNEAIERYEETRSVKKKMEDAQALADHFNTFVKVWYPQDQSVLSGEEIVDIMDITSEIFDPKADINDLLNKLFNFTKKEDSKKKSLEDMIAAKGW